MAHAQAETELVVERPGEHWRRPDVAQTYDSGRFDNLKGRLYRWREERAIELALQRFRRGSTVLDAACGTGRITALLQRNGFRPTGCDVSPAMLGWRIVASRLLAARFRWLKAASSACRTPNSRSMRRPALAC